MEEYSINEVAERLKELEAYNETFKDRRNFYRIELELDMNDADYVTTKMEIPKIDFENDLTLKLVLSYLMSYGKNVYDNYGFNVPRVYDYMTEMGMIIWSDNGPAHSVCEVSINFIDNSGQVWTYSLPDFRTLFLEQSDGFDVLNHLLGQYYGKKNQGTKKTK